MCVCVWFSVVCIPCVCSMYSQCMYISVSVCVCVCVCVSMRESVCVCVWGGGGGKHTARWKKVTDN